MEPMDIDWKNIKSIFVVDDMYEHINAPKWVDFSAPERLIGDEAWFCRPDCRHPKNADDFRRSPLASKVKNLRSGTNSEVVPLGERNRRDTNLKRRGILSSSSSIPSHNDLKPKPSKKNFRDDGENENPNHHFPQSPPNNPISEKKTTKSAIKSSAEKTKKKKPSDSVADPSSQEQRSPMLKSSLSARNLFAGRDILNQISEFCSELKRLALNGSERGNLEKSEEPLIDVETQISEEIEEMRKKEKQRRVLGSKIFSPDAWKKKKKRSGEENRVSVDLKGDGWKGDQRFVPVRSCPPSPQRFPSPSTFQKPTRITPLKPPKSRTTEKGILQELEWDNTKTKESVDEDENRISVSGSEGKSLDVFWFLKPCTYLGK